MAAGYFPSPTLILCDYLKSYDYRERSATFIERVSDDLVEQIVSNIPDLIDPTDSA